MGVLTVFFVAGASVAGNSTAEVAPTWEEARVFLPGSAVPLKPAKVPARGRPLPTVLYLHGCSGFDYSHDGPMGGWAQTLTAAGYAVAVPTSFAREVRPQNCDTATHTGGLAMEAMDMRLEELEYALTQLRASPWVDQRNLFLMGHSEGGITVARWSGGEFNGHIISGWTCTAPPPPIVRRRAGAAYDATARHLVRERPVVSGAVRGVLRDQIRRAERCPAGHTAGNRTRDGHLPPGSYSGAAISPGPYGSLAAPDSQGPL